MSERHADGLATDEELAVARADAERAHRELFDVVGKVGATVDWAAVYVADSSPIHAATTVSWMAAAARGLYREGEQPAIIPCTVRRRVGTLSVVLGKWEVIRLDQPEPTGAGYLRQSGLVRDIFPNPFRPTPTLTPAWLTWNGGVVRALARSAYDDRELPSGHLDPVRLALLADALEDSGCADAAMLEHLRVPGPHVRGCWVVDLLLGKE